LSASKQREERDAEADFTITDVLFYLPVVVAYDGRTLLMDAKGKILAWVRPNDSSSEASHLADALAKMINLGVKQLYRCDEMKGFEESRDE
jgi:hypothetical protein